MPGNFFRKLFRRRQRLIEAADNAVAQAVWVSGRAVNGDREPRIRLAAKKFEKAAALYRRAGLGLLAREQYAAAARCYSLCSDSERTRLNEERRVAVSTYWEEADDA